MSRGTYATNRSCNVSASNISHSTGWAQSNWSVRGKHAKVPRTCSGIQVIAFTPLPQRPLGALKRVWWRFEPKSSSPRPAAYACRAVRRGPSVIRTFQDFFNGYSAFILKIKNKVLEALFPKSISQEMPGADILKSKSDELQSTPSTTAEACPEDTEVLEAGSVKSRNCDFNGDGYKDSIVNDSDRDSRAQSTRNPAKSTVMPEVTSEAHIPSEENVDGEKSSAEAEVVLRNVSLSYGSKKVLDNLNLTIWRGEGTALIGSSGTGKSTTLRLITGLELPDEGSVSIRGWTRTKKISQERPPIRISMVFQHSALFDSLTIGENVGFELLEHTNLPEEKIYDLVEEALNRVGLVDVMHKYPGQLSGGMKRRASFARAIIYNPEDANAAPELLLYDEPSTGLDPTSSTRIENIIRKLQEVCPTYVVVTHQFSTIRRTADRVIFLHDGKVQWDGRIEELDTTDNPYVRQFMSASLDGPLTEQESFNGFDSDDFESIQY